MLQAINSFVCIVSTDSNCTYSNLLLLFRKRTVLIMLFYDLCVTEGDQFKLFLPVSQDEIFISFVGVMLGLLLLTIALLGHLLGFHIYLSK